MRVMLEGTGGRRRRLAALALGGSALAMLLAGCQTANRDGPVTTGSLGSNTVIAASDLSAEEAVGAVQHWGAAYGRDEKDKVAALNYAAALRAAGETGQAVSVMRKAAIYHPEDREVLAAFGKALAADGRFKEALVTVRRAQRSDNPDWQLLSTEGGILDSIGAHEEARRLYQQALVLAPGEPQILNNLGLSYVLTNELDEAERILQEAAAHPKATLKIRENLALVLKLQDDRKIGEITAPAGTTQQGAVGEENTWDELATNG
jgi:Flp pilus assembly protein TadD